MNDILRLLGSIAFQTGLKVRLYLAVLFDSEYGAGDLSFLDLIGLHTVEDRLIGILCIGCTSQKKDHEDCNSS